MAWNYQIDAGRRLVTTTAWNTVTGADVLEHRDQLKNDRLFQRDFFQLVNLTGVKEVQIDFLTMAKLADEHLFSPRSRRAFVAPHPLAYGMANMFIHLRGPVGNIENNEISEAEEMEIFNSCEGSVALALSVLKIHLPQHSTGRTCRIPYVPFQSRVALDDKLT